MAYYPEMLAQLGWPDEPAVMVGDDIEREVKPTQAAGLPVFWVRKPGEFSAELAGIPQGSCESFRTWLEKTDLDQLKISFESTSALLALLRSSPSRTCHPGLVPASGNLDKAACTGRMEPDRDHLPPARRGT